MNDVSATGKERVAAYRRAGASPCRRSLSQIPFFTSESEFSLIFTFTLAKVKIQSEAFRYSTNRKALSAKISRAKPISAEREVFGANQTPKSTLLISPLQGQLPPRGSQGGSGIPKHFSAKREKCAPNSNPRGMEGSQALHHKSAGRALPARGEILRSIACDAGVKISYLSDFAPENFRRNFSKIRKPKNSSGNEFPE